MTPPHHPPGRICPGLCPACIPPGLTDAGWDSACAAGVDSALVGRGCGMHSARRALGFRVRVDAVPQVNVEEVPS